MANSRRSKRFLQGQTRSRLPKEILRVMMGTLIWLSQTLMLAL